jgi:tetratricopeptide (TPR) repeat protein
MRLTKCCPRIVIPAQAGIQASRSRWIPAFAGMTYWALVFGGALASSPSSAATDLSQGITAWERHRWPEAMEVFLAALHQDPSNTEAHAYVTLLTREMEARRQAVLRDHRLRMLAEASQTLEKHQRDPSIVQQAYMATAQAENRAREDRWRARLEEAHTQRITGQLLSANDTVFQVLAENPSFPEAQRELSEIQSQIRQGLDSGAPCPVTERYALEGFYAFGQADYLAAVTAWTKARILVEQSERGVEAVQRLQNLHFTTYAKMAQARVEEAKRLTDLRALFEQGVNHFQEKRFARSLEEFRRLAIQDPEYPQLGYYLVQAEAGAEAERAERLGKENLQEMDRLLRMGLADFEKGQLPPAAQAFESVLHRDPAHPEARSYLAMVRAEMDRRHDPKAAQMHYEAGLIAYASGKLEEASREWHLAVRLNPELTKAQGALNKVQKELALYREVP